MRNGDFTPTRASRFLAQSHAHTRRTHSPVRQLKPSPLPSPPLPSPLPLTLLLSPSSSSFDRHRPGFEAQADAVSVIFSAKTGANPENTVGVMTMGGAGGKGSVFTPHSFSDSSPLCFPALQGGVRTLQRTDWLYPPYPNRPRLQAVRPGDADE